MLRLCRELLLTILEELDRVAATSYRKPVAVSDGIDLEAVFNISFSWFYDNTANKTVAFPDYHQFLNDIFMNTQNYDFGDIVTGLRAIVDERAQQREREMSRTLLLIVIAACQLSERSNGGRTGFFARKPDNQIKHQAFAIYSYFNMLDRRHNGRLPAWEGLRIVREYRL
jgi:hypothetical protein